VNRIDNGTELKNALVKAMRLSLEANAEQLQWVENDREPCTNDACTECKRMAGDAERAKQEVVDFWKPIAKVCKCGAWKGEANEL
jgi:hypothetical protein